MVNLDDAGPLITLGGLFLAGQSSKGRKFTGGESGKGMLAAGFAGSSAEFVVDEGRNMAGVDESTLSDELGQVLLGAGVSRYGDMIPQNKAMARGIMYNAAVQSFQDAGATLGDIAGGGSTGSGSQSAPQRVSAQNVQNATHNMNGGHSSGGQVF